MTKEFPPGKFFLFIFKKKTIFCRSLRSFKVDNVIFKQTKNTNNLILQFNGAPKSLPERPTVLPEQDLWGKAERKTETGAGPLITVTNPRD